MGFVVPSCGSCVSILTSCDRCAVPCVYKCNVKLHKFKQSIRGGTISTEDYVRVLIDSACVVNLLILCFYYAYECIILASRSSS